MTVMRALKRMGGMAALMPISESVLSQYIFTTEDKIVDCSRTY